MGKHFKSFDWISLLLIFVLTILGLFVLLSIDKNLFTQQFFYIVVGIIIAFSLSKVHIDIYKWLSPILYIVFNLILLLVFIFPPIRGSHRWIQIAGEQFQPSEFFKPVILIFFSFIINNFPINNLKNILINIISFIIPFALIFKQPDLGTSIIFFAIWISALIAGGFKIRYIVISSILLVFFIPFLYEKLAPYQQSRLITFINPGLDPKGSGYNSLQAVIAIGSGQIFGKGLGMGTQSHLRFLPEYHTDFIFASLVEELGFIGGLVLLITYLLLIYRILLPVLKMKIKNRFVIIYTYAFVGQVICQVFVNAGMNMGLLPITGITMPFVSYGGSSIISLSISFGILWALQNLNNQQLD